MGRNLLFRTYSYNLVYSGAIGNTFDRYVSAEMTLHSLSNVVPYLDKELN